MYTSKFLNTKVMCIHNIYFKLKDTWGLDINLNYYNDQFPEDIDLKYLIKVISVISNISSKYM
jgi:hypothetical protein